MKTIQGNLIKLGEEGEFDVIIHGCNCFHRMGAGIAKSIRGTFPAAYKADCETEKGSEDKLGSISAATIGGLTVVNAYTQFHWSRKKVNADYEAIRSAMKIVKERYSGLRIGYPRIGAGLAGGDWKVIAAVIDEELSGEDHTLVEFVTPEMDSGAIYFYSTRDPFGEFSNFYAAPFRLKGRNWKTVEHYFQAQKFAGTPSEEELRNMKSPMMAARAGRSRKRPLRKDWESVKEKIMREGVAAKFEQNEELKELLLGTENRKLVEHTTNDSYWGDGGDGSGKNRLGIILMETRERLKNEQ